MEFEDFADTLVVGGATAGNIYQKQFKFSFFFSVLSYSLSGTHTVQIRIIDLASESTAHEPKNININ